MYAGAHSVKHAHVRLAATLSDWPKANLHLRTGAYMDMLSCVLSWPSWHCPSLRTAPGCLTGSNFWMGMMEPPLPFLPLWMLHSGSQEYSLCQKAFLLDQILNLPYFLSAVKSGCSLIVLISIITDSCISVWNRVKRCNLKRCMENMMYPIL